MHGAEGGKMSLLFNPFFFLIKRLPTGNLVMVDIYMCGKKPIKGEHIHGITWKHVYFNISVSFIIDTTSISKLLFSRFLFVCVLIVTRAAVLPPLFLLRSFFFSAIVIVIFIFFHLINSCDKLISFFIIP